MILNSCQKARRERENKQGLIKDLKSLLEMQSPQENA